MKPTVYIETSVISYLTSRPSRDLIAAARQELTRRWWAQAAPLFDRVTSEFAIREAEEQNRATFAILSELRGLAQNEPALSLTNRLVASGLFSDCARVDALHIAIATVHNCDYLLTWKCESIASATRRRRFNSIVVEAGFAVPVICTPPQLHGGVPLCSDPIIEEVWRVREEHARKYNYDIGAIAEHMRERSRSLPGERVMLATKPFQRRASVRKNADEQEKP